MNWHFQATCDLLVSDCKVHQERERYRKESQHVRGAQGSVKATLSSPYLAGRTPYSLNHNFLFAICSLAKPISCLLTTTVRAAGPHYTVVNLQTDAYCTE